jgi:hypothetical protein
MYDEAGLQARVIDEGRNGENVLLKDLQGVRRRFGGEEECVWEEVGDVVLVDGDVLCRARVGFD